MDALWRPIADAVMRPVFGDLVDDLDAVRSLGGLSGESYVDKDLRTPARRSASQGPFNLALLRRRLAGAVPRVALERGPRRPRTGSPPQQGEPDPAKWRKPASRTGFTPGLIPNTFPTTNRPTFQQVLELERHGP